jgi:NAD(P)-dependent dehydrogenase (short-subunit alcohol dehydrogenase family)
VRVLAGKVAIVTGAARGIGRAIAERFAAEGALLALCDVDLPELDRVADLLRGEGTQTLHSMVDVADSSAVCRFVEQVVRTFGGIDILVNNAGITRRTPLLDIPEDEWDLVFATNTKGAFLLTQAVARHMVEQGRRGKIINMGSTSGQVAHANKAHYCSSKAALIHLTRCAAVELGPHGINVNAVCPCPTATEAIAGRAAADRDYIKKHNIVLGRLADMEDVANAVLFLATPASDHVTGHALNVDGGEAIC